MRDSEIRQSESAVSGWFTPLRFGLLLGALLFAAFPRVLLGLDSFCFRDYGVLGYPFVAYHHDAFWRGEIPLWNPLSNCGAPFLAQWGTMTLYPFSLIYLLFPLPWSLTWFCFGHLFLGGMGMYFLSRRWTENSFAASVAGTAYVFSGAMFSSLIWPNYQVALGWMPWVIFTAERAWKEGGKCVVVAGLVAALQMLSGVPEIALFTWGLAGLLWLETFVQAGAARWALVRRGVMVVILVTGLIAAQLLPFFDLLTHSQRDRHFASASRWAMPGWGWANFFVPLFHCLKSFQGPRFQQGQEFMSSYYLGISIMLLAVGAAWRVRQVRVWLLSGAALLSLILALGDSGHLYAWARAVFPPLGVARFAVKFVFVAAFVVPLLAAYFIARLEREPISSKPGLRFLICGGMVAVLLIAAILWFQKNYPFPLDHYWPEVRRNGLMRALFLAGTIGVILWSLKWSARNVSWVPRLAVLTLIFLDTLSHVPEQNPRIAASNFTPNLWQRRDALPAPRLGDSRVMISPEAEEHLLRSQVADVALDFTGKRLALWSNLNLLDGIPKVNGSSTLQLREQAQVQALLYPGTNQFTNSLIQFVGVSRHTKPGTVVEWTIWTNSLPVITCGQKPFFECASDTLQRLVSPKFDPQRMVYLPADAKSLLTVTDVSNARILSHRFSAHRVEIEVEAGEPALVVVAQSFYHPWQASVDGMPAPLLRANHAFQAIQVPAGHHQVLLRYQDRQFLAGVAISLLTLIGAAIYWLKIVRTGGDRYRNG